MKVLLTGGCGYIGTHICWELLSRQCDVIVVDNLSNSNTHGIRRVSKHFDHYVNILAFDLQNEVALDKVFKENKIDAVIHLAGLKSVGESVSQPLKYYQNNLLSTMILLKVMEKHNVTDLIFSGSATVYKDSLKAHDESDEVKPINPYGKTKLMIEVILQDHFKGSPLDWRMTSLRYFNPIGAHPSGLIGENPTGVPANLVPYIVKVIAGEYNELKIFGDDYDQSKDGTCVRDYIHVVDLAEGHVNALENLRLRKKQFQIFNLGTGNGYSVLDVIKTFESLGLNVPYTIVERRPGDDPVCFANPSKANLELKWKTKYTLEDMCRDSWNWWNKKNDYSNTDNDDGWTIV